MGLLEMMRRRRERKWREAWLDGYDFAAGRLLRGEETPGSIEHHWLCPFRDNNNGVHPFDIGMEEATNELVSRKAIKDDRPLTVAPKTRS